MFVFVICLLQGAQLAVKEGSAVVIVGTQRDKCSLMVQTQKNVVQKRSKNSLYGAFCAAAPSKFPRNFFEIFTTEQTIGVDLKLVAGYLLTNEKC